MPTLLLVLAAVRRFARLLHHREHLDLLVEREGLERLLRELRLHCVGAALRSALLLLRIVTVGVAVTLHLFRIFVLMIVDLIICLSCDVLY